MEKKSNSPLTFTKLKNSNYLFNRQIFLTKYKFYSWNCMGKKEFPEESDTSASLQIDVRTGFFIIALLHF